MKTELTQTDKAKIEDAKTFLASARFLSHQAEKLIHEAVTDVLRGLAEELKWEEMDKIARDLPDSTEKYYAIQYVQATKEEWERSRKVPY